MTTTFLEIDIKELAERLARDLELNDRLKEKLAEGAAISGWSNAIVDNLTEMYSLENLLIDTITES